jgi:hypothetical protein
LSWKKLGWFGLVGVDTFRGGIYMSVTPDDGARLSALWVWFSLMLSRDGLAGLLGLAGYLAFGLVFGLGLGARYVLASPEFGFGWVLGCDVGGGFLLGFWLVWPCLSEA